MMRERYQGSLLGLAAGDALGTTVEFSPPGTFAPLTDIVGGGPFHLEKGQWTDDTSMALCLAESLVRCGGFDARDQMTRYSRWREEGYLSSNGRCFDIGNTVSWALSKFGKTGGSFAGPTDPHSAGNGSLMRLAPVPLFFAADPKKAIHMSAESSRTTHGTLTCLDACRYFAGLIVGAIQGTSKEALLSKRYAPVKNLWEREPLCPEIDEIASGSFKHKDPPEIVGSGYVVKSLEAALWAFDRSSTFKEGCLLAVNLGNDADTTGAIYGQLAGAFHGAQGISIEWRNCLAYADLIQRLSDDLFEKRI
jgi:ADP-ribosyl-[dinitrogen reductase] hydrolase